MNDVINESVNAIKGRVKGPLGYITTSILIYNWAWLYFLAFSKETAEKKILIIQKTFPTVSNIGIPFLFGTALCFTMPFIMAALKKTTSHARNIEIKTDSDESTYAELYLAQKKLDIARKNYEKTEIIASTEELKKNKEDILEELRSLQAEASTLLKRKESINSDMLNALDMTQKIDLEMQKSGMNLENHKKTSMELMDKSEKLNLCEYTVKELNENLQMAKTDISSLLDIITSIDNKPSVISNKDEIKFNEISRKMSLGLYSQTTGYMKS